MYMEVWLHVIKFVELNRLWGCGLDLFGSRWEMVSFCEYGNERLGCVKGSRFPKLVCNCCVCTNNSASRSYVCVCVCVCMCVYRVSQEECSRLREGVPYVKVYRYNPKHLCPKLNRYGDNGQRKVWSFDGSTHCTCQLTVLSMSVLECGVIWWQFSSRYP
jgi:hypothetical protein